MDRSVNNMHSYCVQFSDLITYLSNDGCRCVMDSFSVKAVAFICNHIQNNSVIQAVQWMDMKQSCPSTVECREIYLHIPCVP